MRPQILALLFIAASFAGAHCQVPCGIYGDDARFASMLEDATTIRKAVTELEKLGQQATRNDNQLTRWVLNKERHAQNIQQVALDYFLAQRLKASQDQYEQKLVAVHTIIVLAMKNKQTASLEQVTALEEAIKAFQALYAHK